MEGEIFVLIIIFGSFVFAGIMHWMKLRADAAMVETTELSDEAQAQINDLKERVRVLERIATDKRERLKEEIDAL